MRLIRAEYRPAGALAAGVKPLCIELFAGTMSWSAGWLELGGYAVGFDIEHLPHHGPVPRGADLVLQDVATLHGSQFKDASLILASPPCPEFSYMAMPWSRGKQIRAALQGRGEFPESYGGSRTVEELTALFRACFRIQREASAAAGRHIPMVVENVRGAQPWVGRSAWNFGSFHLWGDVPALMPMAREFHEHVKQGGDWFGPGEQSSISRTTSSKSPARKAASALIAKIPLALSQHIASVYYPR